MKTSRAAVWSGPLGRESAPRRAVPRRRFRKALTQWLAWNDAYERATAEMFAQGGTCAEIEDHLDRVERLRQQAIAASRELLN